MITGRKYMYSPFLLTSISLITILPLFNLTSSLELAKVPETQDCTNWGQKPVLGKDGHANGVDISLT